jgi:hypothetical protein
MVQPLHDNGNGGSHENLALGSGSVSRKPRGTERDACITFEAHGVRVRVRVNDSSVIDPVVARLPHGWQLASSGEVDQLFSLVVPRALPKNGSRSRYRVYGPDGTVTRAESLNAALDTLESNLQICVAELAQDRVFLHAGVVGWRGRAIVLPGRSFAGKTTLVRELVRAGATYYSDEYAVLDGSGLVHPFARPLAIREGWVWKEKRTVESLGGKAGLEPIPVGLVILSQYRPHSRWKPKRLSPGEGLLELLNHAVAALRKPAAVMEVLERVVTAAPVMRTMRGDARSTALRILRLLDP